MKHHLIIAALIGACVASPVFASVTDSTDVQAGQQSLTRAQVKAQLAQASAAGQSLPLEGQLLPIEDYSANVRVIRKSESESKPIHLFAWLHHKNTATTTE